MKYLVDTDRIVDYLKGDESAVGLLEVLAQEGAALSLITYGEVYEGIYFGRNREQHEDGFRGLLQIIDVLPLNQSILKEFARIRGDLRVKGQLIGDFDILIAATALHHDLTLVTHNLRHFTRVPNLNIYEVG